MPPDKERSILSNRHFLLFLISQNLVTSSSFIQTVAVARLIMQNTNSGLITGFSIVCAPLPGILFSLFAGRLGDRLSLKGLLISYDIFRALFVLLFPFCTSTAAVFGLMLVINLLDVLYSPTKNKVLTSLIGKNELIKGNSILNGGNGAVSLIIPLATGILISCMGVRIPFIFASACHLISALCLSALNPESVRKSVKSERQQGIAEGLKYCFGSGSLKKTIFTLAALDFGTTAVNIAFYSLAFDKLHVTSDYWGLLLSVFYGVNVVSMAFLYRYRMFSQGDTLRKAHLLLLAVTFVWFFYSIANTFHYLLIGAAAEGFCSSLISTTMVTRLQETARKEYMARVMGIRDLCSSFAKIAGIGLTVLLMKSFGTGGIFVISGAIVFLFAGYQLLRQTDESRSGDQLFKS